MGTPLSYRNWIAGLALLAGMGLCSVPAQGQPGPQAAPVRPVEGSIFGPQLQLIEQTKPGVLLTRLSYSQNFDTNVAVANSKQLYGSYGLGQGDFTYAGQRSRQTFFVNYKVGGRIYSPKFSDLNMTGHDVRVQGSDQLTSRLSVSLLARYADQPSIGEFLPPLGPPQFGVLGSPEENIPFLARRSVEEQGALTFNYRVAEHTSVNVGGNYMDARYQPSSLLHTRGYSPYVSVFHNLTGRQTVGAGYISQWIQYPGQPTRVRVDNFLGTYSIALSQTSSIAVYGGPGWAHLTTHQPGLTGTFSQTGVTLVGGALITKTLGRLNKFSFNYSRAYSQSSQLIGASLRQSVGSNYVRAMTPRLSLEFAGNYTRDTLGIVGSRNASNFRVQAAAHYRLRPRINLIVSEAYTDLLDQAFNSLGLGLHNRNVASVGVQFILPTLALEK